MMIQALALSVTLFAQDITDKSQTQQLATNSYELGKTTQQLDNTQTVAWGGIIIAVISATLNVAQMINKRLADKDKADTDRLAQKDKLDHDSTLKELKQRQKECEERSKREEAELARIKTEHKMELNEIKKELALCNDKHAKSDERLDEIMKLIIRRKVEMEDRIESKVHEIQAQIEEINKGRKDDSSVRIQAIDPNSQNS